ncbi:MAG: DUF4232 domain-containing protein [Streptosporangiaceae bacterium]
MIRRPFLAATLAATGLAVAGCGGGTPAARPTKTITVTASPSTPAPATSQPASAPAAGAAPGCLTRYLNGSIGLTQGTAGSVQVTIVFKNLNNVPCTLYGFPGVALATGTPVTDVGQPSSNSPATARELVTLAPGGFANATLQIADAGNFPASACTQVATGWLAVIPPNQTVPLYIPLNSTGCQGSAKLLTVTAVRPGNGG